MDTYCVLRLAQSGLLEKLQKSRCCPALKDKTLWLRDQEKVRVQPRAAAQTEHAQSPVPMHTSGGVSYG